MKSNLERFDAWVVYCDIYGFSAFVEDEEMSHVIDLLHAGHDYIQVLFAGRLDKVYVRLISDSIFLVYRVSEKGDKAAVLQECISDTQKLMGYFADIELPLRGSIAYGNICIGENLILGKVVLRAVRSESLLPAPLVLLPLKEINDIPDPDKPMGVERISIKGDGMITGILIQPMPVDSLIRLAYKYANKYCLNGPYVVGRVWQDAYMYLKSYKKNILE